MNAPTWKPELRKVSDLVPLEKNPRKITPEKMEDLKRRIRARGMHDVLKVDTNGVVLAGNQHQQALEELGMTEVYVMVPDRKLTKSERDKTVLESNIHDGVWDRDVLVEYGKETLLEIGFESTEVDKMLSAEEDDFDVEEEVAKITKPITQVGDVWALGEHRLICGDSTSPEVFKKLMGEDALADMCWTDPPYNVDYDYTRKYTDGMKQRKARPAKFAGGTKVFNDDKSPEQFYEFLLAVFKNVYDFSKDSSGMYVCHATKTQKQFFDALAADGFHFSQTIIWLKERIILALGQDYHRVYEPIWYGWKKGKKRWSNKTLQTEKEVWDLDRLDFEERLDVWYLHRDKSKDYIHPTQKPVRLSERAIKKSCPVKGIVIEPFAGSGSALIACQQLMRKCYAIELDPRYVDAIVKRWERVTGEVAKKT